MPGRLDDYLVVGELIEDIYRGIYSGDRESGLGSAQWSTLRYFAASGKNERTITGLSKHMRITKGPASRAVSALQRRGLVTVQRSAADGRLNEIVVSRTGRKLLERDPLLAFATRAARRDGVDAAALEAGLRRLREILLS